MIKIIVENCCAATVFSLLVGSTIWSIITFMGCTPHQEKQAPDINHSLSKVYYIKGSQTNLCWKVRAESNELVLINVPCTPEVEKLIRHE